MFGQLKRVPSDHKLPDRNRRTYGIAIYWGNERNGGGKGCRIRFEDMQANHVILSALECAGR